MRYTSFKSSTLPCNQILSHDKHIISLSSNSVRLNHRRGLSKNFFTDESFKSLSCMQLGKDTHELFIGGNENQLVKLNLDNGKTTSVSCTYSLF